MGIDLVCYGDGAIRAEQADGGHLYRDADGDIGFIARDGANNLYFVYVCPEGFSLRVDAINPGARLVPTHGKLTVGV